MFFFPLTGKGIFSLKFSATFGEALGQILQMLYIHKDSLLALAVAFS